MENLRRQGLIWVLLCAGISILWGTVITRHGCQWVDFRTVYAGARCLIHHQNPYKLSAVQREYESEDGPRPQDTPTLLQCITLQVNLPTTYALLAPFAALSWGPAHILWMLLTGCVLVLAILLMWSAGNRYAPHVSTLIACAIAINCEIVFTQGNTAGLVVGLCGIAVWCFIENRFVRAGVVCLALSLAIKPHDAGLVWLYFVLAGGLNRKRALQSLVVTAALGLGSVMWFSHVAPTWMHDWNANLATISAPGGINEPGPDGVLAKEPVLYSIVDLQAAISILRNDPRFYNFASYLICGTLLLVWLVGTLRRRFSIDGAWFALAAVVPLTLLINYHRLWDAKLVMVAIPACCLLWARGGAIARAAIFITCAATFFIGEISLAIFEMVFGSLRLGTNGILWRALTAALIRPASLALLAMGVFYLWVYLQQAGGAAQAAVPVQELEQVTT